MGREEEEEGIETKIDDRNRCRFRQFVWIHKTTNVSSVTCLGKAVHEEKLPVPPFAARQTAKRD